MNSCSDLSTIDSTVCTCCQYCNLYASCHRYCASDVYPQNTPLISCPYTWSSIYAVLSAVTLKICITHPLFPEILSYLSYQFIYDSCLPFQSGETYNFSHIGWNWNQATRQVIYFLPRVKTFLNIMRHGIKHILKQNRHLTAGQAWDSILIVIIR